jgi:hypothetical protein
MESSKMKVQNTKRKAAAKPDAEPELIYGITGIRTWLGMDDDRPAYTLAQKGLLPGVFKLSPGKYVLSPRVAREIIEERARGTRR